MKRLLAWTLDTIRQEDASFSWMEEYRFDWAPLVKNAVLQSVEGKAVLIVTDDEREWFKNYILTNINNLRQNRPLLPFYSLKSSFPQICNITTAHDLDLLEDVLEISYPQGYYIWYIGKGDDTSRKIADRGHDNFVWVMDEDVADAFVMRCSDPLLDIKLLQLYKLFDKTLSSVLFGDLDLEA